MSRHPMKTKKMRKWKIRFNFFAPIEQGCPNNMDTFLLFTAVSLIVPFLIDKFSKNMFQKFIYLD